MKRTLLLDENDLIMVVKEDVIKQIDDNRGELNRTEFVNHLIQCQLKEQDNQQLYVTREELEKSQRQIMELLHNFLQFFISYGMAVSKRQPEKGFQALKHQLDSLGGPVNFPDISDDELEDLSS